MLTTINTHRGNNLVTLVEELINAMTKAWDEELLNDLFRHVDIHQILQILLRLGREDVVA